MGKKNKKHVMDNNIINNKKEKMEVDVEKMVKMNRRKISIKRECFLFSVFKVTFYGNIGCLEVKARKKKIN